MIRKLAFNFLRWPGINQIVGQLYKSIRRLGIIHNNFVFPYSGIIQVHFDDQNKFSMCTDGADTIASSIYQDGIDAFEPEMRPIFETLIKDSRTFLDVGANTGFYSLLAATLKPNCTIHAFEPVPAIFDSLKKNVQWNKFEQVTPHLTALSNETKTSSLFVPKSIRISTGASQVAQFEECEEIPCQFIRLDEFVQINNLPSVDFMKIDTETTEPMVLEGGLQTISKFRPFIIIEILNDRVGAQIENLIAPLNYRYYHIVPGQLHLLSTLILGISRGNNWNFLLVPQEKFFERE